MVPNMDRNMKQLLNKTNINNRLVHFILLLCWRPEYHKSDCFDKQKGSVEYYTNKYTILLVYKIIITALFGYINIVLAVSQLWCTFRVRCRNWLRTRLQMIGCYCVDVFL
jgi:hypothetical protein